mmetsp:Transcript_84938/g.263837  ORF Transcript_84938/g.263837 Transcript_84938/m.263837 type:complete len:215 (-) Transcript_84938:43-687(-)
MSRLRWITGDANCNARPFCLTAVSTSSSSSWRNSGACCRRMPSWSSLLSQRGTMLRARFRTSGSCWSQSAANLMADPSCFTAAMTMSLSPCSSSAAKASALPLCSTAARTTSGSARISLGASFNASPFLVSFCSQATWSADFLTRIMVSSTMSPEGAHPSSKSESRSSAAPRISRCSRCGTPVSNSMDALMWLRVHVLSAETSHSWPPKPRTWT